MDGNGRWAKARGLPRIRGHEKGAESVRSVLSASSRLGIRFVTLYAFSVENWKRPMKEISALMALLGRFLERYTNELHDRQVRLRVLGCVDDLPVALAESLRKTEEATRCYTERTLVLALSYGGRREIADSVRSIARKVEEGLLDPDSVDEKTVAEHLYLPDIPDPDLIIRTSGEQRLSNFLLWQCAYSELYCTPVLWPDFGEAEFEAALLEYQSRNRRYGGLGKAGRGGDEGC